MHVENTPVNQRPRAFVSTYLPVEGGSGVERFIDNLSNLLEDMGFNVICLNKGSVGQHAMILSRLRPFVAWSIGRRINKTIDCNDLVICNGYFSWNARRSRSMVVYHGTEKGRYIHASKKGITLSLLLVGSVGAFLDGLAGKGRTVIAVSSATRNEIERYYRIRVDHVIPNAVDLQTYRRIEDRRSLRRRFGLPTDKFLALYIGPNEPRKGIRFILSEILPKLDDDVHMVLRSNVKCLDNKTTVLGRIEKGLLPTLYNSCDVLILPSMYEGCSFTLVEAMACGTPVITSRVGSAVDMATDPKLKEYVVDDYDSKAYIDRIRKLRDPGEWESVSRAVRRYAEANHDIYRFREQYRRVVEAITGASQSA